jgi:hypothetical protein
MSGKKIVDVLHLPREELTGFVHRFRADRHRPLPGGVVVD